MRSDVDEKLQPPQNYEGNHITMPEVHFLFVKRPLVVLDRLPIAKSKNICDMYSYFFEIQ